MFVREQAVVGLAVGFLLGGAVSKLVTSLVTDIINPMLAPALNVAGNLRNATFSMGPVRLLWGDFVANVIDFAIIALVIYIGVHILGLDRVDRKKEDKK